MDETKSAVRQIQLSCCLEIPLGILPETVSEGSHGLLSETVSEWSHSLLSGTIMYENLPYIFQIQHLSVDVSTLPFILVHMSLTAIGIYH